MTSPPYWALRDYGVVGQLGLEPTFQEYINKLVTVFDEIKRVLKKEGSCWVVIGDTYGTHASGGKNCMRNFRKADIAVVNGIGTMKKKTNFEKSLLMIPERFAIAMIDHGWILRNKIIWHKRNCMPSSAKDRFTIDYEYLYFFTKSQKYYFETQYEPHESISKTGWEKSGRGKWDDGGLTNPQFRDKRLMFDVEGRIKRSVWTVNTAPFSEAHFAVYPEKLCETPIKAGCPVGGTVLDCFAGAATTGLVALKLARNFIGIELNPEYIKIAQKRLEPYLLQSRLIVEQTAQNL